MTHMNTDRNVSNALGIVMLAAAAGALAALMLTPKRGTEMQEDLRTKYNSMKNKMHNKTEDAREKMSQGTEAVSTKTKEVANKTKNAAGKASDEAKFATGETDETIKQSRS